MKRIGEIRRKIGKPTIFNLVGPLTNPVPLTTQFVGINKPDFTMEYAAALSMAREGTCGCRVGRGWNG